MLEKFIHKLNYNRTVFVSLVTVGVIAGLLLALTIYDETPAGYNVNDYQKLRRFLELPNGGKRNGNMVCGDSYSQKNPATWSGVTWSKDIPKRITQIDWHEKGLVGNLDVSGCKALQYINCNHNQLKNLKVHGCKKLKEISCYTNQLSSLKVTGCISLETIECQNNQLICLNISGCKSLWKVICSMNKLSN